MTGYDHRGSLTRQTGNALARAVRPEARQARLRSSAARRSKPPQTTQRHKPSRETSAAFAFMGAARLVAILLSLRPTLCLGLRVADGLGQHLAQLGLGLRRFARWCPLPCSHEQYVGMRSGELNPSNEGRDASLQPRRVRLPIPIEALSLAITCKFGNIRAREAFEGAGMTMQTEALAGAEDYFLKVLKPNKEAFFATPSTFASALNLATSLFHFHEWLFGEFKTKLEAELGTTFHGNGSFWQAVENTNPKFGYMRDVTNASKLATAERHKSLAEDCRRCQIQRRHRGPRSAGKPRRLIAPRHLNSLIAPGTTHRRSRRKWRLPRSRAIERWLRHVCGTWLRQVNVGFQGESSHALDKVEPPSLTARRDIKFPARAARGGPSTST